jgi:rhodanese-related sulfurtransferase
MEEGMGDFFISAEELRRRIGTGEAPLIYDVRRREAFAGSPQVLPTARWREHTQAGEWSRDLPRAADVVLYCVHGHNVSQLAATVLREAGLRARVLQGGFEAWRHAGLPLIGKAALPGRDETKPSRWVTRLRPKIDRIACPWLIRRFIDAQAQFYFVEPEQVVPVAKELHAIAYDVEGVEITHAGALCTFDTLIERFGIGDAALRDLAPIVRGADTGRFDLAAEAAGLLAVSLGISALCGGDDAKALDRGFPIYDALYAWRRSAAAETHGWPPKGS